MAILGLNHAVLYVRDAQRSSRFYQEVLDFVPVIEDAEGRFAFLRSILNRCAVSRSPVAMRLLPKRRPIRYSSEK